MERFKIYILVVSITALSGCILFSGCTPYAERKQAMEQRWEKSAAQAKLPLVEQYLQEGRLKDAYKLLQKCLQADPHSADAHYLAGRLYLQEGRYASAAESFRTAVELKPGLHEAWFVLGILYQDQDRLDQARDCYGHALELQPARVDYILSLVHLYTIGEQIDQARQLLEEKRKKLPYDSDMLIASAELAQRQGNSEEAVQLYKEALLRQGNNPQILEGLGVCYMARQQWQPAADVFEKLLQTKQDLPQEHVLGWLAYCTLQAGQYGKALNWYDKLSVYRREDPQLWLEMGQAALGAEQAGRARQCAQKALQYQPAWTDAEVVIGCALYMDRKYSEAVRVFQKVSRDSQWEAFGWWMAGRCYQQLGQNAQARNAFEKASQIKPDSPMMQLIMGEGNTL